MSNIRYLCNDDSPFPVVVTPFMKEWRVEHQKLLCDESESFSGAVLLAKQWANYFHSWVIVHNRTGREYHIRNKKVPEEASSVTTSVSDSA